MFSCARRVREWASLSTLNVFIYYSSVVICNILSQYYKLIHKSMWHVQCTLHEYIFTFSTRTHGFYFYFLRRKRDKTRLAADRYRFFFLPGNRTGTYARTCVRCDWLMRIDWSCNVWQSCFYLFLRKSTLFPKRSCADSLSARCLIFHFFDFSPCRTRVLRRPHRRVRV